MQLERLIDPDLLDTMVKEGYIKKTRHPSLPLSVYSYTDKAQYDKKWNQATLTCRGLIVRDDGLVVARPFGKFFNWDEQNSATKPMSLDEPVIVTDKLDGSLGILYDRGGWNYSIATRGSFTSDQARHANELWLRKYARRFGPWMDSKLTYLFEIIYPENRIVVDYEGLNDLVLIAAVDIESGYVYSPQAVAGWPGPIAHMFPFMTMREALSMEPRTGKEGFVVRSLMDGLMVKIKQEDYVKLHKIVTGLNEKEVWRRSMSASLAPIGFREDRFDAVIEGIPDEFHAWVLEIHTQLEDAFYHKYFKSYDVFTDILESLSSPPITYNDPESRHARDQRKEFASKTKDLEPWLRKTLWMLYDGINPQEFLWKQIEPKGDVKK